MGEYFGVNLDDDRILKGLVTPEEIGELERDLVRMYVKEAKKREIPLRIITDRKDYEKLKAEGKICTPSPQELVLLMESGKVQDMTPIAYHLINTPEGLFYAKLMQQHECRQH